PNIDDLRESPAVNIAQKMLEADNANIILVEPNINQLPEKLAASMLVPLSEVVDRADVVAILVAHDEFKDKTPLKNIQIMNMVGNI
ncbi:UDP binding domain-containing protein, partial [Pseudomonas sp. HY7a-MNA-CIBAN-0227]